MRKLLAIFLVLLAAAGMAFAAGQTQQAATATQTPTIQVYDGLWENIATIVSDLNGTPLYQELERQTGVKVDWIHPPAGSDAEFFNLMIASGDLPDAIYRGWTGYPGGPSKAIDDGVIVPLNDIMDANSPNFLRLLSGNALWNSGVRTDDGTLYMFPFIRGHESLMVFFGPALRADWLEELNLEVPQTIAEWETVLTALTAKTGGLGPLTFTSFASGGRNIKTGPAFISAYGLRMDFFRRGNTVAFGQYEPAYRDFLETFHRWYANGLIDREFITNDMAAFNAKVLNDQAAAFVGYTGSNIGVFLDSKRDDPSFDLVAAPYPTLQRGQLAFSGQMDFPVPGQGLAITPSAADPATVARWADYAYGEEGHILMNFGLEGESYNWDDGVRGRAFEYEVGFPRYADGVIYNNRDGWGVATGLGMYTRAVYSGPIIQDPRYFPQYVSRPQQQNAVTQWSRTDAVNNIMPPVSATTQESSRFSAIMTEVNTYADEMFVRFVVGDEPLSNFDQYRAQLRQMGIEEAIALRQAALDRFNAR